MNHANDAFDWGGASGNWRVRTPVEGRAAESVPELVSQVYQQAPVRLRARLLECLLRPVGPLALVTIAAGAFARFMYRLQRDAMPISLDDAARITSDHVRELARYVEQCNPDALVQFGALIADRSLGFASISGSALLMALSLVKLREAEIRD
jgi:hypothetical protein